MKKLIFALCLVLLSGAAWGQMNYGWKFEDMKEANKDLSDCTGRFWAAMREKGIMVVTFEEKLQWCTENPPPPPLADSRYRLEKNEKGGYMTMDQDKSRNIWGASRYRLEKNEVTGRLAISEKKDGAWKIIQSDFKAWIWPKEHDLTKKLEPIGIETFTEQEMIESLEKFRANEREDKAWRPIR